MDHAAEADARLCAHHQMAQAVRALYSVAHRAARLCEDSRAVLDATAPLVSPPLVREECCPPPDSGT